LILLKKPECRALFPKIAFVESDSMPFQKLTKLFLIRKSAVMRVAQVSIEFPQNAGTAADPS
jgi:hypothetical protein